MFLPRIAIPLPQAVAVAAAGRPLASVVGLGGALGRLVVEGVSLYEGAVTGIDLDIPREAVSLGA